MSTVLRLLESPVKEKNCEVAWRLTKPCFFDRLTKDATVDPAEVSKNGGFRDAMKGYLVPCHVHMGECAGFYLMIRSKNTKCQLALTFVRRSR